METDRVEDCNTLLTNCNEIHEENDIFPAIKAENRVMKSIKVESISPEDFESQGTNDSSKKIDDENLYDIQSVKEEVIIAPEVTQYPHDNTTDYESSKLTEVKETRSKKKQIRPNKTQAELDIEELYKNHIIKDELVIGPVVIQKPYINTYYVSFTEQHNKGCESKEAPTHRESVKTEITKRNITKNKSVIVADIKNEPTASTAPCESTGSEFRAIKTEPGYKRETEQKTEPNTNKCNICDKTFSVLGNLTRHLKIIHGGIKPYKCSICDDTFKYIAAYRNHQSKHMVTVKIHVAKYVCTSCKKGFGYQYTRDRHERLYCKDRKNKPKQPPKLFQFICDVCQKVYRRKHSLVEHLGLHFGGRPQFQCDMCSKKYTRKQNLKFHLESKHMKKEEYTCSKCRKIFSRQWYLRLHKRSCFIPT